VSLCDTCPIEEKLWECCGRHPMTGERSRLVLSDGTVVQACPHLDAQGLCSDYASRPQGCMNHFCEKIRRSENLPGCGKGGFHGFTRD